MFALEGVAQHVQWRYDALFVSYCRSPTLHHGSTRQTGQTPSDKLYVFQSRYMYDLHVLYIMLPYDLYDLCDLAHVSWVGSVLHSPCTIQHDKKHRIYVIYMIYRI